MIANIPAGKYEVWTGFHLALGKSLTISDGNYYQLIGPNGCGKTSFLKKLMIPAVISKPEQQYVIYVEQQIQSQFDAIKADALLAKYPKPIDNFEDMINYQFECLQAEYAHHPKPVLVISDECPHHYLMQKWLDKLSAMQICLIFITHLVSETGTQTPVKQIVFEPVASNLTNISLL